MMNKDIAISVKNVSKAFRIPHEKVSSVRGAVVSAFNRNRGYEEFQALDDVSFEVKKGEFFGIIGRNGSGKSTLLKVLASIYQADSGKVQISGLISPFLELGIGFNPELSGRDNVYLNATVLGMTKKQIDEKFDAIVAFSELERFIDQKLKNYSSGMQVRLAFSVSIYANRDILLMDEVLAVGDSNFQSKCLEEFAKYRDMGRTVIIVTHDISVVQRYCDRAMLLRNGKILKIGKAEEVGNAYVYENMSDEERRMVDEQKQKLENAEKNLKNLRGKELVREKQRIAEEKKKLEEERKNKVAEITKVEFLDKNGNIKNVFETGDDITARIYYSAKKKIEKPVFGVAIHTSEGILITGPNTKTSNVNIDYVESDSYIDFIILGNKLFTGNYRFTAAIFNWECIIPFDFKDRAYVFKVVSQEENQNGLMKMDVLWKK
ncbi:MAG: ABC transporter ATP-binding protein [Minisyncoccota bacterium]